MNSMTAQLRPNFPGKFLLLACCVGFLFPCCARAQNSPGTVPPFDTETTWPGIHYQLVRVQRILQNRLMVEIRVWADPHAPAGGVFLGTPGPTPPPNIKPSELFSGRYNPKPFSLAGSTMTDELSGAQYRALPAIAPPGKAYYSSVTMAQLRPGNFQEMSIQFAAPPQPPAPAPGQPPVKQTLSFALPRAKEPIAHVPLSPP